MPTLFSKIINNEIPCYKIAESENCFAFLDVFPLAIGHVLVVPKIEEDYLFDLDDELLSDLMIFAKQIAVKIKKSVNCKRVGVAVIGLEVPHAHIHLVPINCMNDINFSNEKLKLSTHDFEEIADKIRKA